MGRGTMEMCRSWGLRITALGSMGMEPPVSADQIEALSREGIEAYGPETALYIRPMMWSLEGGDGMIPVDPSATGFALCIEDLAMPAFGDYALGVSSFRRPRQDMAVNEAKAACLYPNNARIMRQAQSEGFNNALSLDVDDLVAETASSNAFMVRDGVVFTPKPNGTFLAGITRMRSIELMRANGIEVQEVPLTLSDFDKADEIFLTGNAAKITKVTRYLDRQMPSVARATQLREIYYDYAKSGS